MSLFSIALPFAGLPAAEAVTATAVTAARPLLGLGVAAALIYMFKPLLVGLLRAGLLVIKPRKSLEERNARRRLKGILMIHRLARDVDDTQPNLAAELRWLAARGN